MFPNVNQLTGFSILGTLQGLFGLSQKHLHVNQLSGFSDKDIGLTWYGLQDFIDSTKTRSHEDLSKRFEELTLYCSSFQ